MAVKQMKGRTGFVMWMSKGSDMSGYDAKMF